MKAQRGEKNSQSILTEEIVLDLRRRKVNGTLGTHAEEAKKYGVGRTAIQQAVNGNNWGYLNRGGLG